jgi:hypothetical protein
MKNEKNKQSIYRRKFMSKISFWVVLLTTVSMSAFCQAADIPIVSVLISTDEQTVKIKTSGEAENVGTNTAKYAITASVDPSSLENNEVKPVDPVWTCVLVGTTFVPPLGIIPQPPNPGNPNVSITTGTDSSWTAKVSSPNAGQWVLKFKVSVTYDQWDKIANKKKTDASGKVLTFGPYSADVSCTFVATEGKFKIKMISTDDFPGHATYDFGLGEWGKIEAWSFDNTKKYTIDSVDAQPADVIKVGLELDTIRTFQALSKDQSAIVTVKAKDGETDLGEEKVTATVVKPSSIYLIEDPNGTGYDHKVNTYGLTLHGRYVIAPFNVSFMKLSIREWGDKTHNGKPISEGGKPGYAYYTGVTDKTKNYFAKIGEIGKLHFPSKYYGIYSCNETYYKTNNPEKFVGGPLLNIFTGSDATGIPEDFDQLDSEPKTGEMTIFLPIRYRVKITNVSPDFVAEVNGTTSIFEVKKQGDKYIITVRKTNLTSKSVNADDDTTTWKEVYPPVLQ